MILGQNTPLKIKKRFNQAVRNTRMINKDNFPWETCLLSGNRLYYQNTGIFIDKPHESIDMAITLLHWLGSQFSLVPTKEQGTWTVFCGNRSYEHFHLIYAVMLAVCDKLEDTLK